MTEMRRPKLAIVGKGGVGKTTIAAGLALVLQGRGEPVFAVDGDSNSSLGYALGFPEEKLAGLKPLVALREELEKRAQPEGTGMYLLAPPVADLIDKYSLPQDNIRLLVMGTIGEAGSGCACALNAALREILRQLVKRPEAIVVDMEAGVEHMGRGTAAALDTMLIVTEGASASLRTAQRLRELAQQLGVQHLGVIGNKVRTNQEAQAIKEAFPELPVLAFVPFLEGLAEPLERNNPATQQLLGLMEEALQHLPQ